MADVLTCSGLEKRFGDVAAVNGVGFSISAGETFGLLGPNGAGKTTAISMVCGLLAPDAGEIHVVGEPMTTRSVKAKRHLGLVPQELAVYPDLSARENLRFFAKLYGLAREERSRRVDEILEVIGLSERADDRVEDHSGGMKRRLNIGIGLLHEPTLLILDEPTVGVDPQSRNAILEAVERLAGQGMGVLYTTHYMEEAERLCDRLAIIDNGVIRAEGTRRELVALVGETDHVTLTVAGPLDRAVAALRERRSVGNVDAAADRLVLTVDDASQALPDLLATATAAGATVTGVEVQQPDLETVFLHLTGRALRDG